MYHANLRAITQVDTVPPAYAAWAVVRHGTFDVRCFAEDRELPKHVGRGIVELPDGRWVSKFPPGSTLMSLPFVAPLAAVRATPLSPGSMRNLGKFIAASYTAAAVAVCWLIARRLALGGALPATILLALGTGFWSTAAQAIWPHGPAVFLLLAALALLIWNRDGPSPTQAAAAGLLLGLAVLTRPPTALCVLSAGACLLLTGQLRAAAAMALGGLPTIAVLLAYRHIYNDSLTAAGYDQLSLYATPWSVGLPGLLISPSRGLLVFCPAAALAGVGLWALARPREVRGARGEGPEHTAQQVRGDAPPANGASGHAPPANGASGDAPPANGASGDAPPANGASAEAPPTKFDQRPTTNNQQPTTPKPEPQAPTPDLTGHQRTQLLAAVAAAVVGGLVYARWFEWWGGWCYGPRFLLEAMPITAVLIGLGWERLPGSVGRALAWALIAVSVAVQFLGVFGHPKREMESWNARRLMSSPIDPRAFFDWSDSQIADHASRLAARLTAWRE